MYNVMIRIGNARKSKRAVFEDPVKAEEYFNELCRRRTEYPATVILAYRTHIKRRSDTLEIYDGLQPDHQL